MKKNIFDCYPNIIMLCGHGITDEQLPQLLTLSKLTSFDCSHSCISDVSKLVNLMHLNCSHCYHVCGIEKLFNLTSIACSGLCSYKIEKLNNIVKLNKLQHKEISFIKYKNFFCSEYDDYTKYGNFDEDELRFRKYSN